MEGVPGPERGLAYALAFQFRDTDILQCTYPKSGFHWMVNILWKLKSEDATNRPQDTILEFAVPEMYSTEFKKIENNAIATHRFKMAEEFQMVCAKGEGLIVRVYEDLAFIDMEGVPDPEHGLEFALAFQFRDTDILQCSYPKCGFHWMVNMLWKLKSEDATNRPQDTILEFAVPETYEVQQEPRIICTHMRAPRVYHFEGKGKIVLMLRNPKDVAVSYYHHFKNAKAFKSQQTWDEFFRSYVSGEILCGSIFEYLRTWEQALKDVDDGKINLNVELFYYEEFLQKPRENLARLNKYLGFNRDENYLERVLEETTLGALKHHYNSCAKETSNYDCIDDEGNSVIFRKGEVGDWKNYFTVAQSELVDKLLSESLQHGLIKFKFEL